MPIFDQQLLHRAWLHSHEEDSGDSMVFRPESHHFPPSRGRYGFVLKPGGAMTASGPCGTDVPTAREGGSWTLQERNLLLQAAGEGSRRFTIEQLDEDKLVVRQET
ncbi:MAG: hypothetical protein QM757_44390 [Paludibaculum sp.]